MGIHLYMLNSLAAILHLHLNICFCAYTRLLESPTYFSFLPDPESYPTWNLYKLKMELDEILIRIGQLGRYQMLVFIIVSLTSVPASVVMLVSVFTTPGVKARCAIPTLPNDTYQEQNPWHGALINRTIPWEETAGVQALSTCKLYKQENNATGLYNSTNNIPVNGSTSACNTWVYDHSLFESTVTETFDLVCADETRGSHAQMLFMSGLLVGGVVLGQLSDFIGRKKVLMLSYTVMLAAGIACSYPPNFWVYAILRFISGAGSSGTFVTSFVISVELVGPSKRVFTAIVLGMFFVSGYFILTLFAYFIRDWKTLQTAVLAPWFLLLIGLWYAPESVRWLLGKGKTEEAKKIILKAAKVNKTDGRVTDEMVSNIDSEPESASLLVLFKSKVLLVRALIAAFNWAVNVMVYYGLTLNSGNLHGSIYVNFTLSGVAELVAYFFCLATLNRWGRKWPLCATMVIGGVACVSTLFIVIYADPENNNAHSILITALSMVGKFCISTSFAVIYIFTAELFPTSVRNAVMGACATFAQVGGILSPYVADLSLYIKTDFGQALPLVIFGSLSIVAGCLAIALPDTNQAKLPETVEDGETIGRRELNPAEMKKMSFYNPASTVESDAAAAAI